MKKEFQIKVQKIYCKRAQVRKFNSFYLSITNSSDVFTNHQFVTLIFSTIFFLSLSSWKRNHNKNSRLVNPSDEFVKKHTLFVDLSIINLFLQALVADQSINITRFCLAITIHSTNSLSVMTRIPGCVKNYYTICT